MMTPEITGRLVRAGRVDSNHNDRQAICNEKQFVTKCCGSKHAGSFQEDFYVLLYSLTARHKEQEFS